MRGDYKSRMEGYAIARQNGWMSSNDIRELENLNPLSDEDGGNAYLCNGNMIPCALAGINIAAAAMASMAQTEQDTQPDEQSPPEQQPDEPPKSHKKRRNVS